MATNALGIIFSSLNDNNLSRLTADRAVGAIPIGCRYRLIDFCLSNLVNANVSNINVVVNFNYRSLIEHIGSGKDWDLARRKGGINIISPYQTPKSSQKLFSTHLEALKNMREYLEEYSEEFIILMDSDNVLNIDLSELLSEHESSGADVTMVTKKIDASFSSKNPRIMVSSSGGKINDLIIKKDFNERTPELCLNLFVMKRSYLIKVIEEATVYNLKSFTGYIQKGFKHITCRAYAYDGYVATISGFLDYYKSSMELLKNEGLRESLFGKKNAPIYTRVHNSPPTVYRADSRVENSMIADGCVIEGEVVNSVLFRGVKIHRGASVRNSVLFNGTTVGEGASLDSIVTDKNVYITDGVKLSGSENMPFYVEKGKRV